MDINKINITDITEGYYNLLKAKIKISKKDIEEISQYRLSICTGCENRNIERNKCGVCGCNLEAKSRARSTKCPIGKW